MKNIFTLSEVQTEKFSKGAHLLLFRNCANLAAAIAAEFESNGNGQTGPPVGQNELVASASRGCCRNDAALL